MEKDLYQNDHMKSAKKITLITLFAVLFLFCAKDAFAISLFSQYEIRIRPAEGYSGSAGIGARIVFDVEIKSRVLQFSLRRGFYYTYQYSDVPAANLRVTFPDNSTRVELTRISRGIYQYTTNIFTEIGGKTLTVRIGIPYWIFRINNFIIISRQSYTIYIYGPPDIEITDPVSRTIFSRDRINVSGTINDNLSQVEVNGVPALVRDRRFTAEGIPISEGENEITARAVNLYGNDADSITVTLDTIPPQNPQITIAQGDYTNSREIMLSLSAEGASEMIISEDAEFGDSEWERYNISKSFTLSEGEGNKTIYAKYRDTAMLESSVVSDSVTLDIFPPQNPNISIEEGTSTTERDIHLILHADDATEMIISEDSTFRGTDWVPYSEYTEFTLSGGLGEKTIYARFRDQAGNPTDTVSCSINLELFIPDGIVVIGRQLYVDGAQYIIKGVTYQPTPVNYSPEIVDYWPLIYNLNNCARDFRLLRNMGCNTIRTYAVVNQALLDKASEYGIKVCAGFWVDYSVRFSNLTVRQNLINDFRDYVNTYKDHPAILMWLIGNEQNYQNGNNYYWYSLANEMAREAHLAEGVNYHPVGIVNGDLYNIGDAGKGADDDSLDSIDIWGVNVYIGYSFLNNPQYSGYPSSTYFQDYAELSGKPLFITECGIDAWDNVHSEENQKRQSAWNSNNWDEIEENSFICAGATFMSYSDEWWKADEWDRHDNGGYSAGILPHVLLTPHPDNFSNEEWWGFMAIQSNGRNPDIMIPRLVYYTLKKKWANIYELLLIDDFNDFNYSQNLFSGNSDVFFNPDGYCSYDNISEGADRRLLIQYDVSSAGSWAGYYTILNNADARSYDVMSFQIKGDIGGEIFKIGIRDSRGNESKINITEYLPGGVTTDWQLLSIPLTTFGNNVNLNSIENISVSFENAIGSNSGTVFIDDLRFETGLTRLVVENFNFSNVNNQNALGNSPWTQYAGSPILEYEFGNSYGNNGTAGISISYTVTGGQNCRWGTGLSRIDISPYENLSFSVKGAVGGEEFYIYLEDRWNARGYVQITGITNSWQTIEIPVETFLYRGLDITSIINLEIVFQWRNASGEIYLDDIQFTD